MRERDYSIQRERDAGKRMRRYMEKRNQTMTGSDLSKAQANALLGRKPRARLTPMQAHETICNAVIPTQVVDPHLRSKGMGERTRAIRKLLKDLGIKGVSVRMATGSMCFWTYVDVPRFDVDPSNPEQWRLSHDVEHESQKKVERCVLAAFPDLDNRSDGMTDYFDFVVCYGTR
jgi:hypothetical protein